MVMVTVVNARRLVERVVILLQRLAARRRSRLDGSAASAEGLAGKREERVDRLDWCPVSVTPESPDAAEQQYDEDNENEKWDAETDSETNDHTGIVVSCRQTQRAFIASNIINCVPKMVPPNRGVTLV